MNRIYKSSLSSFWSISVPRHRCLTVAFLNDRTLSIMFFQNTIMSCTTNYMILKEKKNCVICTLTMASELHSNTRRHLRATQLIIAQTAFHRDHLSPDKCIMHDHGPISGKFRFNPFKTIKILTSVQFCLLYTVLYTVFILGTCF